MDKKLKNLILSRNRLGLSYQINVKTNVECHECLTFNPISEFLVWRPWFFSVLGSCPSSGDADVSTPTNSLFFILHEDLEQQGDAEMLRRRLED
jgi:hypothetical protein